MIDPELFANNHPSNPGATSWEPLDKGQFPNEGIPPEKASLVPPETGTVLDPNAHGNIFDQADEILREPQRQAHAKEYEPLYDEIIESGVAIGGAMAAIARHNRENGVVETNNDKLVLKLDGEQYAINRDGTPADVVDVGEEII